MGKVESGMMVVMIVSTMAMMMTTEMKMIIKISNFRWN